MPSSRGSSQPGIEPASLVFPALAGRFFTWEAGTEAIKKPSGRICDSVSGQGSLPGAAASC